MWVQKSKRTKCMWERWYWNPTICSCENVELLAITIDGLVIMCDEIINLQIVYQ